MKNKIVAVILFLIIIFVAILIYLNWPVQQPSPVIQQNQPQTQTAPEAVKVYTYPKGYPEELAFDLSRIENMTETKDANGKNVVIVQFTSKISVTDFPNFAKRVLELNKWTITQGQTGAAPQVIVATRGSETATVSMVQSGTGTTVKVNYQQ